MVQGMTIRELLEMIMDVVRFEGWIVFNSSKANGTMREVLNINYLNTQNWETSKFLPAEIADIYKFYKSTL